MSITNASASERTAPHCHDRVEPLAVPPKVAWRLLGICNTTGYGLLAAGELRSYTIGRARRITMESIRNLIARGLDK